MPGAHGPDALTVRGACTRRCVPGRSAARAQLAPASVPGLLSLQRGNTPDRGHGCPFFSVFSLTCFPPSLPAPPSQEVVKSLIPLEENRALTCSWPVTLWHCDPR